MIGRPRENAGRAESTSLQNSVKELERVAGQVGFEFVSDIEMKPDPTTNKSLCPQKSFASVRACRSTDLSHWPGWVASARSSVIEVSEC